MLRSASSRAVFGISLAVIWSAAMLGFAMMKEMPVGRIQGRVVGAETGRPIEGATVWLQWKVKDNPNEQSKSTKTDSAGRFVFADVPTGDYTVEASAKVHSLPRQAVTVTEGRTVDLDLKLEPGPPNLSLYANQNTYISKEKPSLVLDGFTKGSNITVISRRIDVGQLFSAQARPVRSFLAGGWSGSSNWRWPKNPLFRSYETRTITDNQAGHRRHLSSER